MILDKTVARIVTKNKIALSRTCYLIQVKGLIHPYVIKFFDSTKDYLPNKNEFKLNSE